jgi:hypothetical protein
MNQRQASKVLNIGIENPGVYRKSTVRRALRAMQRERVMRRKIGHKILGRTSLSSRDRAGLTAAFCRKLNCSVDWLRLQFAGDAAAKQIEKIGARR